MKKSICLISLIAISLGAIAQDNLFVDRYIAARNSDVWEGEYEVIRHLEERIYDMVDEDERIAIESENPEAFERRCLPHNLKEMYMFNDTISSETVTQAVVLHLKDRYEELFSFEKKEKQAYAMADVKDDQMSEIFVFGFKDGRMFSLGMTFHEAIPKEEWFEIVFNSSVNSIEELEQADEVEFTLTYKGKSDCDEEEE